MNDIIWLTMRRLRTPLIILLLVYFVSVFAMVSVPGVDPDGNPVRVGFLDAAYFVTILATTIGFGEVPYSFTSEQRLLVFAIILPNVVAWLYSIGTILGLFLDPQFRAVMRRSRFARRVRWLGDPFFIVCGFGNTGSLVVKGLLRRGLKAVVLELSQETVHRMTLD
nr:potassium transporter TrkA [Xanthomonadales bacterium]NIX12621.1 potassium transporter TrkA [Xanthomonadales bacterium]